MTTFFLLSRDKPDYDIAQSCYQDTVDHFQYPNKYEAIRAARDDQSGQYVHIVTRFRSGDVLFSLAYIYCNGVRIYGGERDDRRANFAYGWRLVVAKPLDSDP